MTAMMARLQRIWDTWPAIVTIIFALCNVGADGQALRNGWLRAGEISPHVVAATAPCLDRSATAQEDSDLPSVNSNGAVTQTQSQVCCCADVRGGRCCGPANNCGGPIPGCWCR